MRSKIARTLVLVLASGLGGIMLTGCPANPPATAAYVDLAQYAGKWYEIAKYPVIFENGLVNVTAEYTLQEDGSIRLINRGLEGGPEGPESTINGTVTVADPASNAKLKVRFDPFPLRLFQANYWILQVGPDYGYAVVSNPGRNTLWILSRTPQMDAGLYQEILNWLETQGFDAARIELTPQYS